MAGVVRKKHRQKETPVQVSASSQEQAVLAESLSNQGVNVGDNISQVIPPLRVFHK